MQKKATTFNNDKWYDLYDDWDLIESSFVTQYGIRLTQIEMDWVEFSNLLKGIMSKTPLGEIVSIRSENDPEVLKTFDSNQKTIRNKWLSKQHNEMSLEEKERKAKEVQELLERAFS